MRSIAIRMKLKRVRVNQREHELGLLPPPNQTPACRGLVTFGLPEAGKPAAGWGRGGGAVWQRVHANLATPTPNPSHKGEGSAPQCAAPWCLKHKRGYRSRVMRTSSSAAKSRRLGSAE